MKNRVTLNIAGEDIVQVLTRLISRTLVVAFTLFAFGCNKQNDLAIAFLKIRKVNTDEIALTTVKSYLDQDVQHDGNKYSFHIMYIKYKYKKGLPVVMNMCTYFTIAKLNIPGLEEPQEIIGSKGGPEYFNADCENPDSFAQIAVKKHRQEIKSGEAFR